MAKKLDGKYLYLVMPQIPINGTHVYAGGAPMYLNHQALAGGSPAPAPKPYVFCSLPGDAHIHAQALTKQHNVPYHIARLEVTGQYIPPPPAWQPSFEEHS